MEFGLQFDLSHFLILFYVIAALAIAVIAAAVVKHFLTQRRNRHLPILTVFAVVTMKRCETTRRQIPNAGDPTGAHGYHVLHSSRYLVSFRLDDGRLIELATDEITFRAIAESDRGTLTYQGDRFLRFERT